MSRRVYLLGVGLALVGLGLGVTDWALSLQAGITERNVRRIRPGMTIAEVESLLGLYHLYHGDTPDNRAARQATLDAIARMSHDCIWGLGWEGEPGTAIVFIDVGGRVVRARWLPGQRPGNRVLTRVRAWLGW